VLEQTLGRLLRVLEVAHEVDGILVLADVPELRVSSTKRSNSLHRTQ
jgi:hypothetical protein